MKSESLKSPFHVSQLSPTWKKCLRLVILRFVSFTCHRCSFWSWWRRNCASVLTFKRRAMLFCILPALNFLNSVVLPDRASLHVTPSTVRSVSRLLPKADEWPSFLLKWSWHFPFSTAWCCMQNSEVQDAVPAGEPSRGTTHTVVTSSVPRVLGEWKTLRRKKMMLLSNGYSKKRTMWTLFYCITYVENKSLFGKLKVNSRDQKDGKWWRAEWTPC